MRTIPVAMTWEMLWRGRWSLPAFALLAFAMPLLVLAALTAQGGVPPQDPSSMLLQVMLVQWNILIFGFAVFSAQGRTAPLYPRPVRTSALVAWRLAPAMGLMALETATFIATLNALYGLDWNIGGPALYAAVALACIRAAFWLTEASHWSIFALTVVATPLALWFKARYGPTFADPEYSWSELTAGEVFTLLGATALAFWAGTVGVARNRRGEAPFSLGILARVANWLDWSPRLAAPFRGPVHAQSWAEWQRKGWLAPSGVVACLATGLVIWLLGSRDAGELIEGFFGGGYVLCMLAFIGGVATGNLGPRDSCYEMGSFLATRPLPSADIARIILRTAAGSFLLGAAIWGAAFLTAMGILAAVGATESLHFPSGLGWWFFPAILVSAWTVMGFATMLGLVGHSRTVTWAFVTCAFAILVMILFMKYAFTEDARRVFWQVVCGAAGAAAVAGTAWAFVAARRRSLLDGLTTFAAATVWAAALALGAIMLPKTPESPMAAYLLGAGFLALTVAPLAVAPLAVAWNRHR
jgi:hypothetical protein